MKYVDLLTYMRMLGWRDGRGVKGTREWMDGWMEKSKKKKGKHCYLFTSLIYTCEFPTKFCTHTIYSYTLLTHRPHNKHNT